MYLLGFDLGSSSVKAALVRADDNSVAGATQYPDTEMEISSPFPGWAEQDPDLWWDHICKVTRKLLDQTRVDPARVKGIGIAYQMHGLVVVDRNGKPLRPSIIWCDSRAVGEGQKAFDAIGEKMCLSRLLNSPGNFTAAKLKWVKEHEPGIYEQVYKFMLPGDYIGYKLTGEMHTTASGLSEGILWDFQLESQADLLLNQMGLDKALIPDLSPTFGLQGVLHEEAARATGLKAGTPVTYRAGDQPNNALSLGVLNPGEAAATGGTSGVVYGVTDRPAYDPASRVNGFVHVNHTPDAPRIGILLCINGTGIQYSWMRRQLGKEALPYPEIEKLAAGVAAGADGLRILPFGNGAERMLGNRDPGARMVNIQFNRHTQAHLFRAALEGIAFSFVYGLSVFEEMGMSVSTIKVGNDNLFQSAVFASAIATLTNCRIEMVKTTGAVGAARAAGVGSGFFASPAEAVGTQELVHVYNPMPNAEAHRSAYRQWKQDLEQLLI